jgi:hypothetical protein
MEWVETADCGYGIAVIVFSNDTFNVTLRMHHLGGFVGRVNRQIYGLVAEHAIEEVIHTAPDATPRLCNSDHVHEAFTRELEKMESLQNFASTDEREEV